MTLKFLGFQFVSINCLLEEKNIFSFVDFDLYQAKMK